MGDIEENVDITVEGADKLARAAAEAKALDDELKKVRDSAAEAGAAGEGLDGIRDKLAEDAAAAAAAKREMDSFRDSTGRLRFDGKFISEAGLKDAIDGLDNLGRKAKDTEREMGGGGGGGGLLGIFRSLGNLFEGGGGSSAASGFASLAEKSTSFLSPGMLAGAAALAPLLEGAAVEATALASGLAAAGTGVGAFAALAIPTFSKIKNGYQSISAAQTALGKAKTLEKVAPTKSHLASEVADAQKLKAAYAGIPASIRPAVRSLAELKTEYSSMAKAFQPDALKVFNGGLKIARRVLPDLKPFADTAGKSLAGMLGHLGNFLKTSKEIRSISGDGMVRMTKQPTAFGSWLKQFHGLEGPSMKAFGKGIGQVGTSFGKLLTTLKPQTVVHGIGLAFGAVSGTLKGLSFTVKHLHKNWIDMSHALGHAYGNVHHAVNNLGHVLTNLHHVVNNVGHVFTNMHHAADNVGHVFTNLHHAVNNVGHVFTNLHHAADNVGHVFTNLHHAADNVGHVFTNMHHAIDNVGHAFTNIHHAADNAGHAFSNIGHAIGNVAHVGSNIGHAFGNVSHALSPKGLGAGLKDIGKTVGHAFDGAKSAVASAWNAITSAIKSGVSKAVSAVAGIAGKIASAAGNFASALVSKGAQLIGGLISGIASKVGGVISAISAIGGKVISAAASFAHALFSAGVNLIKGLISGIESMAGAAAGAISSVVGGLVGGAESLLGIHSPSKVFHKIGQQTIEGFILGLEGGKSAVQAAMRAVLGTPAKDGTITSTVKKLQAEINEAFAHGKITPEQRFIFTQKLADDNSRLQQLAQQRKKILNEIKAAEALAKSVESAAISGASITGIAGSTQAGMAQADQASSALGSSSNPYQSIQQGLQAKLADIKKFRADIIKLKHQGLDRQSIKQLLQAGVEGGGLSTAEQILGSGPGAAKQIAKLQQEIGKSSKALGITGANAAYENGSQIGKGLAAGLKDSLKSIDKAMDQIARSLVTSLMTAMGASSKAIRQALKKLDSELGIGGGSGGGGGGGGVGGHKVTPPHVLHRIPSPIVHPAGAGGGGTTVTPAHLDITIVMDGKVMDRQQRTVALRHAHRNTGTGYQLPGRNI